MDRAQEQRVGQSADEGALKGGGESFPSCSGMDEELEHHLPRPRPDASGRARSDPGLPVESFGIMSPYEARRRVQLTSETRQLSSFAGQPTVLHLYTG